MPIGTRSRQGIASVVTDLIHLLDRVNLLLPPRTSSAITRWKTLSTALGAYHVPVVGPRHGRTPSLLWSRLQAPRP